jgi:hypothetical protein
MTRKGFDPNQPRDPQGEWTKVGGYIRRSHGKMTQAEKKAKLDAKRAAAGQPKHAVGDRVIWNAKHNGKSYPATVKRVEFYGRTAEPWQYTIVLDKTPQTSRMTGLSHTRYVPESQLSKEANQSQGPQAHPPEAGRTDVVMGNVRAEGRRLLPQTEEDITTAIARIGGWQKAAGTPRGRELIKRLQALQDKRQAAQKVKDEAAQRARMRRSGWA